MHVFFNERFSFRKKATEPSDVIYESVCCCGSAPGASTVDTEAADARFALSRVASPTWFFFRTSFLTAVSIRFSPSYVKDIIRARFGLQELTVVAPGPYGNLGLQTRILTPLSPVRSRKSISGGFEG